MVSFRLVPFEVPFFKCNSRCRLQYRGMRCEFDPQTPILQFKEFASILLMCQRLLKVRTTAVLPSNCWSFYLMIFYRKDVLMQCGWMSFKWHSRQFTLLFLRIHSFQCGRGKEISCLNVCSVSIPVYSTQCPCIVSYFYDYISLFLQKIAGFEE